MKNIKEKYLLWDLHDALLKGCLSDNLVSSRDLPGIYLVVFRIIRDKDNRISLIYHYMPYSALFTETLLLHLMMREEFVKSSPFREWGDFFTFIDNSFESQNELVEAVMKDPDKCNSYSYPYSTLDSVDIANLDVINILKKFVTVFDVNEMSLLLNLAYKKDYISFFASISRVPLLENKILSNIDESYNLVDNCLFVVKNLEKFLKSVGESTKLAVSQGPQKQRGLVNSMHGFLWSVDEHYRQSLFQHHKLHFPGWNSGSRLTWKEFTYNNIHKNLGNVRWYSTKRKIKIVSSELLVNKTDKKIKEDSLVFNKLSDWLSSSPINDDTQLKIEKFLYDFSYISYQKKENNSPINYNLINSKLSSFLIDKESVLSSYINNLRSKVFNKIPKNPSHSFEGQYYLNIILSEELNNTYIISVIYGRLLRIISNFNKLNMDNKVTNTSFDIGEDLVRNYFFNLYYKQISKSIKVFINELDVCFDTNNYFIKLEFKKVKKIIKQKNPDKSDLIHYTRNLIYKIKKYHKNSINTNLTNIMKYVDYSLSDWFNDNEKIVNQFNNRIKGLMGLQIIEWMSDSNLIWLELHIIGKEDKYRSIVPNDEILNLLKDTNKLLHLPRKIPMIVKPKPYYREKINGKSFDRLGGYLLNDGLIKDNIIKEKWDLGEPSIIKDDNLVFDLVNNISSVGFKINKDVLDFINEYGIKYDLIIDNNYINPLLKKSKLIKSDRIKLEGFLSKKLQQENILGLAKVFSNVHEFFIPVRVEFRSRMNCVSEYLNYQSSDLAKSLLLFSKYEKILKTDHKAIGYFKAYGANCFGNKLDKKSWNDRIKWVDDNEENIINFKNGVLISRAENKLLFIAFCFEYNRWLNLLSNNEINYLETNFPIKFDATCNGYQHLALLSSDYELAKELNLTKSTWDDIPKDFYNYFTIRLNKSFKDKLKYNKLNEDDYESYDRLSKFVIPRSLIKLPVMTNVYGATIIGMSEDILKHFERCDSTINKDIHDFQYEWYQFLDDTDIKLRLRDITYLSLGIKNTIMNMYKLGELFNYLNEIADICTKLDIPITWTSPNGVEVRQSYLMPKEVRLKPFTYSKTTFQIKIPNKSLYNKRRQKQAYIPNFVHSLDASALALLVDLYFNGESDEKSFYAIHDCFASTANNMENLIEYLKLAYIKIYSKKQYLRELDNQVKSYIKSVYKESFNEKTGYIITDEVELKFPDVEVVLDTKLDAKHILESSYLTM